MFFDIAFICNNRDNFTIKKINKLYNKFCNIRKFHSYLEAKKGIREKLPDILFILINNKKVDENDIKFINQIDKKYNDINIIICSNDEEFIENHISSLKKVFLKNDFFEKNYDLILNILFENIGEKVGKIYGNYPLIFNEIIGNSIQSRQLKTDIKKASNSKAKVLLTGEEGNEYVDIAFLIHKNSMRSKYNFAFYDISQNPEKSISELFGMVEKRTEKKGLLEHTYNGTIFIKNIHSLSKEDKEKFISFLRSGTFSRVNSKNKLKMNNRIITHIPINQLNKSYSNTLDKELYKRLSTEKIIVPSVKQRKEDFILICNYLIEKICEESNCKNKITSDLILKLLYLDWNGNMEDLYFYLKWLMKNLSNDQAIALNKILNNTNYDLYNKNLKEAKTEFEIDYIKKQLDRFGGHITNTAKFIGMNRIALHKKLKDLGIHAKNKS